MAPPWVRRQQAHTLHVDRVPLVACGEAYENFVAACLSGGEWNSHRREVRQRPKLLYHMFRQRRTTKSQNPFAHVARGTHEGRKLVVFVCLKDYGLIEILPSCNVIG